MFGKHLSKVPDIKLDIDFDQKMDISFISIGGMNNYKSVDCFTNPSNNFIRFDETGRIKSTTNKSIKGVEGNFDFGIILKIHPKNKPNLIWICVAGMAEWGTSGASWWLSQNWGKIHKETKDKPFACITKTIIGSDDSTDLVHLFLSKEDVEKVTI